MKKHSPAPWFLSRTGRYVRYRLRDGSPVQYNVADLEMGPPPEEQEANGHLITAAPEMLEVLETIENDAGQVPAWLWDRIQSVIAQATGAEAIR